MNQTRINDHFDTPKINYIFKLWAVNESNFCAVNSKASGKYYC